jgi:hypothetical protein
MCRHRWRYAGSLSRAECPRCRMQVERAGPDPDGKWHDRLPVALRAAQRSVKQQATHLA